MEPAPLTPAHGTPGRPFPLWRPGVFCPTPRLRSTSVRDVDRLARLELVLERVQALLPVWDAEAAGRSPYAAGMSDAATELRCALLPLRT